MWNFKKLDLYLSAHATIKDVFLFLSFQDHKAHDRAVEEQHAVCVVGQVRSKLSGAQDSPHHYAGPDLARCEQGLRGVL
jgi:hypothetical protein